LPTSDEVIDCVRNIPANHLAPAKGQLSERIYSFTYDRIGGRLSRDAALVGSVGLKTRIGTAGYSYSLDGANGIPRAGRIGPGGASQVSVRKRFGQGYTMTVNYTFGKSLDTTSAAEALGNRATGGLAIDPYRPNLAYGLSNFDRRHQLNAIIDTRRRRGIAHTTFLQSHF
jgi:hypothetical protein